MNASPLLQVRSLSVGLRTRDRGDLPIIRKIDLEISRGESIGIVGESGSGKSTLAMALMGFLKPGVERLEGTVLFDRHDMFGNDAVTAKLRGGAIAYVPQNAATALTPTMTIGNQFDEALRLHSSLDVSERRGAILEMLADLRLPDPKAVVGRYPHELSGGQQQRCAIGLAMAGQPKLIVLDEPTTALDTATQASILELLAGLAERTGTALLYVSHNLGVVGDNCGRLAVMYAGEIVEEGMTQRLLSAPSHPYSRGLLGSIPSLRDPGIPPAMWGSPPAISEHITGCRFSDRCPKRRDRCSEHPMIGRSPIGGGVRCHFPEVGPAAARVGTERRPTRDEPVVTVRGLSFLYARPGLLSRLTGAGKAQPAIQDIDLELNAGQTIGVIGESGSGKSTLLRVLLGLHRPSSGEATMLGHDLRVPLARRPLDLKRQLQVVFQNPSSSLNPRQTILEIIASPLRLYFRDLDQDAIYRRVKGILEQVRLGTRYLDRYPSQLSGGEKQRVAIARALAAEPRVILCDEVTSALDVSVQAAVLQVLSDIQKEHGTSYVFVSHDLATVRAISDHIVVLSRGRIVEAGPANRVFGAPEHDYTKMLLEHTFDPADIAVAA